MEGMPNHMTYLQWKRFEKWEDVTEKGEYGFPCVYAVTDKDGRPFYIGSTEKWLHRRSGKLIAGGIRGRYLSSLGALKASIRGSSNSLFVASGWSRPPKRWAKKVDENHPRDEDPVDIRAIEKELISLVKPKYNDDSDKNRPIKGLELVHLGDPPRFHR